MGGGPGGPGAGRRQGAHGGQVYVVDPATKKLKPVKVRPGITDGNFTSIESDELKEGDEVVTGLVTARAGENARGGPRMRM